MVSVSKFDLAEIYSQNCHVIQICSGEWREIFMKQLGKQMQIGLNELV